MSGPARRGATAAGVCRSPAGCWGECCSWEEAYAVRSAGQDRRGCECKVPARGVHRERVWQPVRYRLCCSLPAVCVSNSLAEGCASAQLSRVRTSVAGCLCECFGWGTGGGLCGSLPVCLSLSGWAHPPLQRAPVRMLSRDVCKRLLSGYMDITPSIGGCSSPSV